MIYPLRIDAISSDNRLRVVETLSIDPNCLPVYSPSASSSYLPAQLVFYDDKKLALLADELSMFILADMEVSSNVQNKSSSKHTRINLMTSANISLRNSVVQQIYEQLRWIQQLENDEEYKDKRRRNHLVPIYLSIREGDILLQDSFLYDLKLENQEFCDPISIASQMTKELKLPANFASLIAVSIIEQIHGVNINVKHPGSTQTSATIASSSAQSSLPSKINPQDSIRNTATLTSAPSTSSNHSKNKTESSTNNVVRVKKIATGAWRVTDTEKHLMDVAILSQIHKK